MRNKGKLDKMVPEWMQIFGTRATLLNSNNYTISRELLEVNCGGIVGTALVYWTYKISLLHESCPEIGAAQFRTNCAFSDLAYVIGLMTKVRILSSHPAQELKNNPASRFSFHMWPNSYMIGRRSNSNELSRHIVACAEWDKLMQKTHCNR